MKVAKVFEVFRARVFGDLGLSGNSGNEVGPVALFRTGLIMGTDPWPVCMGSGSGSADYSQMEGVLSRRGLRNLIGLGSGSGSAG